MEADIKKTFEAYDEIEVCLYLVNQFTRKHDYTLIIVCNSIILKKGNHLVGKTGILKSKILETYFCLKSTQQ
jgi:hypothetical protein